MIERRTFCAGLGATALVGTSKAEEKPMPLRVIAYNVFACAGWPKDRWRSQRVVESGQMAERLGMELALYQPDLVNFSESPPERLALQVADRLRMNHLRFPSAGHWPGTILTGYGVLESQNVPMPGGRARPDDLFTRHWGRAVLRLPEKETLVVHSAHLMPGADPAVRLREIDVMLAAMQPDIDAGRSMILMGDLNHGPDTEEYQKWMASGWVDSFAKVGEGDGFTITSDITKWRIDYIMAHGPLAAQITESRPLFEGAFRLNINDPAAFALSDHVPQWAKFGP